MPPRPSYLGGTGECMACTCRQGTAGVPRLTRDPALEALSVLGYRDPARRAPQ